MSDEHKNLVFQAVRAVLESKSIPCLLSVTVDSDGDAAFNFRSFSPASDSGVAAKEGGGYFLVACAKRGMRFTCIVPNCFDTASTSTKEDLAAYQAAFMVSGNPAGAYFVLRQAKLDVRATRMVPVPFQQEHLGLLVHDSIRATLNALFHWRLLTWSRGMELLGQELVDRTGRLTKSIDDLVGPDPLEVVTAPRSE